MDKPVFRVFSRACIFIERCGVLSVNPGLQIFLPGNELIVIVHEFRKLGSFAGQLRRKFV